MVFQKRAAAAMLLVGAGPAFAATGNVPFAATVLSTCTVTVGTAGVMAANSDFTVLDTEEAGGNAGLAAVVSTGAAFSVSVDEPTAFLISPTGGNDNLSFDVKYDATGVTTASGVIGSVATLLNPGLTTVSVDLKATKSVGVFSEGAYTTEAVVRCE